MNAAVMGYVPGSAIAVAHGRTAVLLDVSGDDPVVVEVAALVEAGGGIDEVLDVLVSRGLKSLADFGAFEVKPDGVRLVVRGRVIGHAGELSGLTAEHTMWQDRWLPQVDEVELALPGAASSPKLVIRSGVVLAASISSGAELVSPPRTPSGPITTLGAASSTDSVIPAPPVPAAPVASVAPVVPPAPVTQPTSPAPIVPVAIRQEVAADAAESGDEFAHLFGATQRPPEEVDVLAAVVEVVEAAPLVDPGATMAAPVTMPATELPQQERAVEPGAPTLITGMPWLKAPSAEVPPAATSPAVSASVPAPQIAPPAAASVPESPTADAVPPLTPAGEPQLDRTVNRSALVGMSGAVMVIAVRCAEGHPSPTYADACRVCGAPLPPQNPVEIPRPTLGQLRLSTGGLVPLDRPLFLGRNPRVPAGYAAEQPNLVRLPDPEKDVSGQHLEVALDYWNVVVRDLGSTNGTEVILPGEMPVALRANDPVIIEPGSRVVLAGSISFTFEVVA